MKTNTLLSTVVIPVDETEASDWSVTIRHLTPAPDSRLAQPPGTMLRRHGGKLCALTSLVAMCAPRISLCKTAARLQVMPSPR